MEAIVTGAPALDSAVVTLDVLHNGVLWGWLVTMNMWTKSIGTGVALVGLYMMRRYSVSHAFYRLWIPLLGLAFVALTLLFTLLDLHQPLRFWHMFVWPHFTSMINIGAWLLNAYMALLLGMFWAAFKGNDKLFDGLLLPAVLVAFFATIYTAGLMGQANAREIWHTPTEIAQMLLAAAIAGSAAFLLLGRSITHDEKLSLAWLLGLSAVLALLIFVSELIFAPQKSEEAAWVIHYLLSGEMRLFFVGGLVIAFAVPAALVFASISRDQTKLLPVAALSALAGLWMVKHAWLIAPQMIPLS